MVKLFSPDGVVESYNRVVIRFFEFLLLALGVFCVLMGKRLPTQGVLHCLSQSYPTTCIFSITLGLLGILLLGAEGIFYQLNLYRAVATQLHEEDSWIRLPSLAQEGGGSVHRPRPVPGQVITDLFLGYTLPDNALISDKAELGGQFLYQATYTTDAYHRRVTPIDHPEQWHHFLVFFGGSSTFGLGVYDNETMPFYVAQYASHYKPYNYGVVGYGPNHMLAQLQSHDLTKEIHATHGIAIYMFVDYHIDRAIGRMTIAYPAGPSPYYALDAHDRLVRKGNFTSGRPLLAFLYWLMGQSQILKYYLHSAFPPRILDEHIRLTARIIEEAYHAFHTQFPSSAFYVLLSPGVRRGKDIIPSLAQAGIKYLDYSSFLDWPHPELTLADGKHPTAKGHRIIAAQLAKDLGICDRDEVP